MLGTFRAIISGKKWIFKGPFDIMKVKSFLGFFRPMWVLSDWALGTRVQLGCELPGSSVAMVSAGLIPCSNWRGMELSMASYNCCYTRWAEIQLWKKENICEPFISTGKLLACNYFIPDPCKPHQVLPADSTCNWPAHTTSVLCSCLESTSV